MKNSIVNFMYVLLNKDATHENLLDAVRDCVIEYKRCGSSEFMDAVSTYPIIKKPLKATKKK